MFSEVSQVAGLFVPAQESEECEAATFSLEKFPSSGNAPRNLMGKR